MGKIVALSLIQLKSILKQWKLLLACFLVPILLVFAVVFVVASLIQPEGKEPLQVAIVDHEKSMETGYIIDHMTQGEHVQSMLEVIETTEDKAWGLLEQNQITAIMIIPEHFSKDLAIGINTPVRVVGNSQRPFQSQLVRYYMESAANFVSAAQSGVNTVDHFLREADAPNDLIKQAFTTSVVDFTFHALGRNDVYEVEEVDALHTTDLKQYYLGSSLILIMMVWAFGILWMTKSTMENTLFRRLLIAGVSTFHRFSSRLLTAAIVLCLQLLLIYPLLNKLELVVNLFPMILLLFGIGLVLTLLFILIETICGNEKTTLITSSLVMIVLLVLGGQVIPTVYLPTWLESTAAFTPNYWVMTGYSLLAMESEGLTEIWKALLIFGIIFFAITILFEKMRIRRMST